MTERSETIAVMNEIVDGCVHGVMHRRIVRACMCVWGWARGGE
jgi:hypothetical protein